MASRHFIVMMSTMINAAAGFECALGEKRVFDYELQELKCIQLTLQLAEFADEGIQAVQNVCDKLSPEEYNTHHNHALIQQPNLQEAENPFASPTYESVNCDYWFNQPMEKKVCRNSFPIPNASAPDGKAGFFSVVDTDCCVTPDTNGNVFGSCMPGYKATIVDDGCGRTNWETNEPFAGQGFYYSVTCEEIPEFGWHHDFLALYQEASANLSACSSSSVANADCVAAAVSTCSEELYQIQSSYAQLSYQHDTLSNSYAELQGEYNQMQTSLEADIETCTAALNESSDELNTCNGEVTELQESSQQLTRNLENLEAELTSEKSKAEICAIAKKSCEDQYEADLAACHQEIEDHEGNIESSGLALIKCQDEKHAAIQDKNDAEANLGTCNEALDDESMARTTCQKDLNDEKEDTAALTAQLLKEQNEKGELQGEKGALESEIASCETAKGELETAKENLTSEVANLQTEKEDLQTEKDRCLQEKEDLEDDMQQCETLKSECETQKGQCETEKNDCTLALKDQKNEVTRCETEVGVCQTQVADFEEQVADLKLEYTTDLNACRVASEEKGDAAELELEKCQDEKHFITNERAAFKAELDKCTEQKKSADTALELCKTQKEQCESEKNTAKEHCKSEKEQCEADKNSAKNQVKECEASKKTLVNQLNTCESEKKDLGEQVSLAQHANSICYQEKRQCNSEKSSLSAQLKSCKDSVSFWQRRQSRAAYYRDRYWKEKEQCAKNYSTCQSSLKTSNYDLKTCSHKYSKLSWESSKAAWICNDSLNTCQSSLNTTNDNLQACADKYSKLNSDIRTVNSELQTCNSELENTTSELGTCNSRVDVVENELEVALREMNDFQFEDARDGIETMIQIVESKVPGNSYYSTSETEKENGTPTKEKKEESAASTVKRSLRGSPQ